MKNKPTWLDLSLWVERPERTNEDLTEACIGLELPDPKKGNRNYKRNRLREFIGEARSPDPVYGKATWVPPDWQMETPTQGLLADMVGSEELRACLMLALIVLGTPFLLGFVLGRVTKKIRG